MILKYFCLSIIVLFGAINIICCGDEYDIPENENSGNMYTSISIEDINGDDAKDIAITYIVLDESPPHPSHIAVILQDSLEPGSFYAPDYYTVGSDAWSIAIGDLNGDGLPDLSAANTQSDTISLLFQDPTLPGKFLAAIDFSTGDYPSHVAIGDIDGDGLNDLAVADENTSILIQNSSIPGTFLPITSIGISSNCVAIGDLNDDTIPDLAITRSEEGAVAVLLQDPTNLGQFFPATYFDTGAQPTYVGINRIDEDLLPDLAVVNFGSPDGSIDGSVSVLLQDTTTPGWFINSSSYFTGSCSDEVAIKDLNGDELSDLAVVNSSPLNHEGSVSVGTVSVLLQRTQDAGIFLSPEDYEIHFQPLSIAIDDLNGDSLPDIAVADDGAQVLFQNPDSPGNFLSPINAGG